MYFQGWVHAHDRLFQMDVSRRTASGTLAELLGPGALPQDVLFRTIGVRRASESSLPILSAATRRDLDAYADGVNSWVARHELPPQYAATGRPIIRPVAAGGQCHGSQTGDPAATVAPRAALDAGAAGGFDGLATAASVDTIALAEAARLSAGWLAPTGGVAATEPMLQPGSGRGSNEWVVSGARTVTGRPLLANDPHLALGTPSTFYLIHLQGDGLDVIGDGFVGVPYVVTGQTRDFVWGTTPIRWMSPTSSRPGPVLGRRDRRPAERWSSRRHADRAPTRQGTDPAAG